ncbi:helix-turn-helix domain-containing protein [Empedobacter falsenii]
MDIGTIIKEARLKIGMSQKELASQIGVDVSFLCKIEKNEKKISLEKLKLISHILKIGYDNLKVEYYSSKIIEIFNNEKKDIIVKTFKKIINND